MQKIIINGGYPLTGSIRASGSKNAVLPLIFASLLPKGVSVLHNVPRIGDVEVAIRIISELGARVEHNNSALVIDATDLTYNSPNPDLISKIRASTYLMGATLSRFGIAEPGEFGGCNFSSRPIDYHLAIAEAMGAKRVGNKLVAEKLWGAKIHLPKPSVGATVNAAIMAAAADGETEIFGYAKEPHVMSVLKFLSSIGAKILVNEESIKIAGSPLHPAEFTVIGDMIEAGSYLVAALMTEGKITVTGIDPRELTSFLKSIFDMGYSPEISDSSITLDASIKSKNIVPPITVNAAPYPAFPTDLQPIIAPLLSRYGGVITDSVWKERFGYLSALGKMGLKYNSSQGAAKIEKSCLYRASVTSPDLRGGMALIIAALSAKGRSEILSPEIILRGYDNLIEKLESLGANIKLINL